MVPANSFASGLFRELFGNKLPESEGVSLIATHDLHIFPLVSFVFGVPILKLGFLEGLVIKTDSLQVQVGFEEGVRSLRRNELFG